MTLPTAVGGSRVDASAFPLADKLWKNWATLAEKHGAQANAAGVSHSCNPKPPQRRNSKQTSPGVSLESMMRVMFGSCTTGNAQDQDVGEEQVEEKEQVPEVDRTITTHTTDEHTPSHTIHRKGTRLSTATTRESTAATTCEPASPTKNEENLYLKLFSDSHLQAEEAVTHLRQQMEEKRRERNQKRASPTGTGGDLPGFFSASSPQRAGREIVVPSLLNFSQQSPEDVEDELLVQDDGVSVISQATLDELFRVYEGDNDFLQRVHSDLTQDPHVQMIESWKETVNPKLKQRSSTMSPFRMTRSPHSHGTHSTKQSRSTKSTLSTQTHEFSHKWQKDEAQYWQDVVKEQETPAATTSTTGSGTHDNNHHMGYPHDGVGRVRSKGYDGRSKTTLPTVASCSEHSSGYPPEKQSQYVKVLSMAIGADMAEI